LRPIAKCTASQVDVNRLKTLKTNYPEKNQIEFYDQDNDCLKIHYALESVYELHEVKSPIYRLIYNKDHDVFRYLVRSDRSIYYLHAYRNYPLKLFSLYKQKKGGFSPLYESEKGMWLSAVEPILDYLGEIVGMVEVDENSTHFFKELKMKFWRDFVFIILGIGLVAFIMLPVIKKILAEEQKLMDEVIFQRDTIEGYNQEIQASARYASNLQQAMTNLPRDCPVVKEVFLSISPEISFLEIFFGVINRKNTITCPLQIAQAMESPVR
jgi:hypothetical protein